MLRVVANFQLGRPQRADSPRLRRRYSKTIRRNRGNHHQSRRVECSSSSAGTIPKRSAEGRRNRRRLRRKSWSCGLAFSRRGGSAAFRPAPNCFIAPYIPLLPSSSLFFVLFFYFSLLFRRNRTPAWCRNGEPFSIMEFLHPKVWGNQAGVQRGRFHGNRIPGDRPGFPR